VTDTALDVLRRAQFDVSDIIRRAQRDVVGAFGLDPQESPHQIIMSRAHWRLRDYGGDDRKAFHPGIIDVPDCKAWNG